MIHREPFYLGKFTSGAISLHQEPLITQRNMLWELRIASVDSRIHEFIEILHNLSAQTENNTPMPTIEQGDELITVHDHLVRFVSNVSDKHSLHCNVLNNPCFRFVIE